MKPNFVRIFPIILFSLLFLCAFGQCEIGIKDFYVEYMRALDTGASPVAIDSLKATTLTPELITKLNQYAQQTDCDPIIHAQDVSKYAIRSLTVTGLGNGWYKVRYKWSADSDFTEIPVKAYQTNDLLRITDIRLDNKHSNEVDTTYSTHPFLDLLGKSLLPAACLSIDGGKQLESALCNRLSARSILCTKIRMPGQNKINPDDCEANSISSLVVTHNAYASTPKFFYVHQPSMKPWQTVAFIGLAVSKALVFPYSSDFNPDN